MPRYKTADSRRRARKQKALLSDNTSVCAWLRRWWSLESWGDASKLRFSCPKVGSVAVSFEQGVEFSDAEYEPRPAAACAAGTFPVADQSADAEKRDHYQVREIFRENGVPFGGQPNATLVRPLEVLEEEKLTRKNSHPHRTVKKWEDFSSGNSVAWRVILRAT
ncbi:hypothetical protein MRX96_010479 [Rhipicephalus microplus]